MDSPLSARARADAARLVRAVLEDQRRATAGLMPPPRRRARSGPLGAILSIATGGIVGWVGTTQRPAPLGREHVQAAAALHGLLAVEFVEEHEEAAGGPPAALDVWGAPDRRLGYRVEVGRGVTWEAPPATVSQLRQVLKLVPLR